jgi:NAD-dependent deacetylase
VTPPALSQAADLIRRAEHAVALTGAGISTASGIPDFRSSHGLWTRYDPMEVASLEAFRWNPEGFFSWVRPLAAAILRAAPNPAHWALARLEAAGRLAGVITQNIDGLHRRAGSQRVAELHGHLRQAACVACFAEYPADDLIVMFVTSGVAPTCNRCGGWLKPAVVLFGEQLPRQSLLDAEAMLGGSDLIVVIGTSLEVQPVASYPLRALSQGAHLIILNEGPTYLDSRADVRLSGDAAVGVPALVHEVLHD